MRATSGRRRPRPVSASDTPVDTENFRSWIAVKGVRDIVSGLFIFILLIRGAPHLLGAVMLAATLIPVGDALVVLRSHGPGSAVFGIHGATAAVMLVISVLLLVA